MKIKNFVKIIIFILISGVLLISLSGCTKSETIVTSSNLEVDTKYDVTLSSINTILERNEQYEYVDSIIKNIEFESYSYTINIFGSQNNDNQIMNARNKRVASIDAKFGNL